MIKKLKTYWQGADENRALPDVVLHIGAPKCGSSAIQRFCISNGDLLKNAGFYYPDHPLDVNGVSGGHTQIASALVNGKARHAQETFNKWLKQAKGRNACLLLSGEAFYGQHEALRDYTKGLNVKVIAYLRHPLEYLLGNHNQGIKRHMSTRRLGDLLPRILNQPTGHLVGLPLMGWADAFGDQNCQFAAYVSPSAKGPLIETQFLTMLGLSQSEISRAAFPESSTNRSYVKSALELKRLLNMALEGLSPSHANQVDWSLQRYSDQAHHERSFTPADVSAELLERIESHLLGQMAPVVARFPELESAAAPIKRGADDTGACLNLAAPLDALHQDAPQVLKAIRSQALKLKEGERRDYSFYKLLDILGIEFDEPDPYQTMLGLSPHQRKVLGNPDSEAADLLREMAILLQRQGLTENALFVSRQAYARRPSGPAIRNLCETLEQEYQASLEHPKSVNNHPPSKDVDIS